MKLLLSPTALLALLFLTGTLFAKAKPVYQKGTILGYEIRRDNEPNDVYFDADDFLTFARYVKVYELRGGNFIYQVDYCGAFHPGKFSVGQVVEYRVNEGAQRLYIRHDGNKEYSCQIEGHTAAP